MKVFGRRISNIFAALIILGLGAILVWTLALMGFRKTSVHEVSAETARRNKAEGKYDAIVDVRTTAEWEESHLPYTMSIPIGNLVTELPEKIPDKNTRILFVCKKGVRASGVVEIARKLGYTNVQAMMGNYKELEA